MARESDRSVPAPISQLRQRLVRSSRTAFVLSGGGNQSVAQVGMLRALLERDIVPDVIVGCSAGAFNGATIAASPSLRGVERLESTWGALRESCSVTSVRLPATAVRRGGRCAPRHPCA